MKRRQMKQNVLNAVIPSRTRVQILVKLFLNPGVRAYLRSLAKEFDVSPNAVRTELNNLRLHKVLVSQRDGRNVYFRANTTHPLFPELSSMVRKITGVDELMKSVVDRLGNLEAAYLVGDYARGADTGIIDVVLVGEVDKDPAGRIRHQDGGIYRKEDPFPGPVERGVFPSSGQQGIQTDAEIMGTGETGKGPA
jgi:DNA-binding transcriptional ArsR family regulator